MNFLSLTLVHIILFSTLVTFAHSRSIEQEYTITVKPSHKECFFQDIVAGEVLDIEYQVIDGGQGNLDINFFLFNPTSSILIKDIKKSDGNHRTTLSEAGHYKICFDNTFSIFNSKTVFFAVMIDGNKDDDGLWDDGLDIAFKAEEMYETKVDDIKDAMDQIRADLTKARYLQDQIRAHEARDRNTAENNYTRVNFLSLVNLVVMITAGLMQVILVRSLFDEKSRLHNVWKKSS